MKLVTDYRDYYDFLCDGTSPTFHRMAIGTGPNKREQFRLLDQAGYLTPPHGPAWEVLDNWWEHEKKWVRHVVVYTDEAAHCAEGKEVHDKTWFAFDGNVSRLPLLYEREKLYCSAFVGNYHQVVAGGSASWRRLQVGPHAFWLEYRSRESWMSNFGDGDCEVIGVEMDAGHHPFFHHPLFAIDFVLSREMYAVDLNLAPGIKGSGVEKYLPAREAVRAIEGWLDHHNK